MFSPGIERALRIAHEAHSGQTRKGNGGVPYILHPIHVAIVLARVGADDETIQAGILHDVVEDCEDWTLERIEVSFSARVRAIVADLTEDKDKSWADRKRHAVDHVPHMLPEAATVKAADKLHNLESLVAQLDQAEDPDEVWSCFNGGRDGTLRVAEEIVGVLVRHVTGDLAGALGLALQRLRERA
ncbi:MAG: bifunctional (p)ppGpp synthetase/guanosine-3',5'-bis(diphosphate) 3'-pyrophosphohydrolase [bacterium]|nr:bifunctional (p)ppGpp synthetase/guanosine-3',5'-bis(diphosphate) 3'-pyrophosphohydrolase [bacterium]